MLDEIKRMGKAVLGIEGEKDDSTETPGTDAPGTDSVETETPTTEIPDEFETENPSTEISSTDAPTTKAPDETTSLKSELELLKEQIKELKTPKPTKAPSTEAPIDEQDFMEGIDFDDATRDPKEFNKLLNLVYKKGVQAARNEVVTGSRSLVDGLPGMVNNNISVLKTLEKITDTFYSENEDLAKYKENVAVVFGEIAASNPDKTYAENLILVGDEVRKRLNLTKPVQINKAKPPKLPSNKGNRRSTKTELTGVEAEIAAMNKTLGI